MNKENFFSEALCQPADVLPYYVSQKLAEKYPETPILEGEDISFEIEAYERDGQCDVVCVSLLHNQIKTKWKGVGKKLQRQYENAWLSIIWQEHIIDVVLMTFVNEGYRTRFHWIVAESREIAENFFRAVCDWSSETRGEILVFDEGWWEKDEELYAAVKRASFDDLILPDNLKQGIIDDFNRFLAARETYEQHGIPWKRGVLLVGPPGNGKTHTVKAIVNHLGLPCLYVKTLTSRCGAEVSLQRIFARARQIKPCLIVMEDIDALINNNTRSFFLNELDGFAENNGVLVLATTNYPKKLDPAMVNRPSRFDRKYHFGLPEKNERLKYLRTWSEKLHNDARLSEEVLLRITKQTKGFSFAYLKELVLSSLMQWVENPTKGLMDTVMTERATKLLEQMKTTDKKSAAD